MGRLAGVVLLAMAAFITLSPTQVQHAAENPSTIAIVNARLWDVAVAIEDGPIVAAGVAGAQAGPQPQPGQVRGVVFHDLNGDGARDPNEPGLQSREVMSESGGRSTTDEQGRYEMELGEGTHELRVEAVVTVGTCVDIAGAGFHPLARSWCVSITNPWRVTTPQLITVAVAPGKLGVVDFGLQPVDLVSVAGNAILEDDFAPRGTEVLALVGDQVCGETTITDDELVFNVQVFGARERPNCANVGDEVHFTVGGVESAETVAWEPFVDVETFGGYLRTDLSAMEDHAWYWFHDTVEHKLYEGATVEAVIGGAVCGQARIEFGGGIEGSPEARIVGFSKLIVPSDELASGCGHDGATVTVRAGDSVIASMEWKPGLQAIDATLPVLLPKTGSAGSDGWSLLWLWSLGLGTIGIFAVGTGALVHWQGNGRELRSSRRS